MGLDPARLLVAHLPLLLERRHPGSVLDLACGDGRNGVYLATHGLPVICCDRSAEVLCRAADLASTQGVLVELWEVDLEREGADPLPRDAYGAVVVFRYLHRPLIPSIRRAIGRGGILIYETFTVAHRPFGKPHNPAFLLNPGELLGWFEDWEVLHAFEGIVRDPPRSIAQIVCRRP